LLIEADQIEMSLATENIFFLSRRKYFLKLIYFFCEFFFCIAGSGVYHSNNEEGLNAHSLQLFLYKPDCFSLSGA
jgi:hypothetical protein